MSIIITTTAPAKPTASQSTVEQENVSATLAVAAPAARVFAALADPTTHAAIDGTGWVQEAVDRAPLTEVGQIFRMDMHHGGHLDGDYRVVNKVEVLDPPRAIGWMTGTEKGDGELEFGGWIWRYDLAPLGPSETERPDRRQAGGHPGGATRSRPGQQLPQYPGQRHRGRVRRMERPGCSIPDAAETARVRDPLLHPRSRRLPDRSGANHGP